jgi:epoxyqueuosine reductase
VSSDAGMKGRVTVDELRGLAEGFVSGRGGPGGQTGWWGSPLLVSAALDDRFRLLPTIAASDHLLPWELLPSAKAVVAFFIPFLVHLTRENAHGEVPCRNWGIAYVETNELISALCLGLQEHLGGAGYRSVFAPPTHNFDPASLTSRWSHKHLAYLAGLGRFGHNAQLITPKGCAGRLGSLVTEADLGDSPIVGNGEACLHRFGEDCLECVERCPVGALSKAGLDRRRCWARLRWNREESGAMDGLPENTHVCGKCTVMLPCSHVDPVARRIGGHGS